jgi:tetratricopeptide (TPR) repeat protein
MKVKPYEPDPPKVRFAGVKIVPVEPVDPNIADRKLTPRELVEKAVASHTSGQFADAERLYGLALEKDPAEPNALTNLGTILMQSGRLEEGIKMVQASLEIMPDQANALNNVGNALNMLKRFEEASSYFQRAVDLKSDNADAFSNLGNALREMGKVDEACEAYERAYAINPAFITALDNKSTLLTTAGRHEEVVALSDRLIAEHPTFAEAYNAKGNALQTLKRYEAAIAAYDKGLELVPNSGEMLANKAGALFALKRLDEALVLVGQACALRPDFANAFFNRGNILAARKRYEEAVDDLLQAAAIKPDFADAHNNVAHSLNELGRYDEAMAAVKRALALNPNSDAAHGMMGNLLHSQHRFEEAMASHDRALAINPTNYELMNNKAMILMDMGRPDDSLAAFDAVLAKDPDNIEILWNKALALIATGHYAEGWDIYECRKRREDFTPAGRERIPPSLLAEGDLTGKTVLMRHEQGLGDNIQMLRYATLLSRRGATVIAELQTALLEIGATVPGISKLVTMDEDPAHDVEVLSMSMPLALGTTADTIPDVGPYIFASQEAQAIWRQRLGPKTRPRIGLVWSGNRDHINDRRRSMPRKYLEPLLNLDADFVSLQVEYRKGDLEWLQADGRIRTVHEDLNTFMDTAGLLENLDLVISVDTSVAHLAGALGRPVWFLLSRISDYRWHLGADTTPWYPTARLMRQDGYDDWAGLVAKVRGEVERWLERQVGRLR